MAERRIVLTVDDMPENLTTIRSILQGYFDVRLAKSAKLALGLLDNIMPELILLDIEMPGMSGFDFLGQMRRDHPESKKIPVIFVTSHASADFITKAINAGAVDYIVKPVKAELLLKKIDAIIGLPETKSAHNPLEDKLRNLLMIIASGDVSRAELLIREMRNIASSQNVHIRRFTDEIGVLVDSFDYEKAKGKIKEFLVYLSIS
ncbi:response regulator [Leadbettera azotonutricia]|uniref:Response regulator receiver HD domain protein n=1 Tax=Leadbettera azotonutricia (strain ATCC BAA-888 / DSM 13862 / ZAS-9) TaxID=545695 RepID=F5YDC2_LEAAZ|nr:response regulator [Leadbettera azotonutricia]AEF80405.1 response regulator receiver HD domain protein [Leadbettera azotonutricia ZAS-9]